MPQIPKLTFNQKIVKRFYDEEINIQNNYIKKSEK